MRTLVRALLAAALALLSVGSAHAQVAVNDQRVEEHTSAVDIDFAWPRIGVGERVFLPDLVEWQPWELVLHFDPYTVAAYAQGPSEVHIPLTRLQDLLRPDPRVPLPSFDCASTQSAALVSCLDDEYTHRLADLQQFA